VLSDEPQNARRGRDERFCEFRVRSVADDDQQGYVVPHDRGKLVGLVADAGVVTNGNPVTSANFFQPNFVGAVLREVVGVALDRQAGGAQNLGKAFAKVSIREEDRLHAARS
jgi:hypothetical protein